MHVFASSYFLAEEQKDTKVGLFPYLKLLFCVHSVTLPPPVLVLSGLTYQVFDRWATMEAGEERDEWSILVTHLVVGKTYYGICRKRASQSIENE